MDTFTSRRGLANFVSLRIVVAIMIFDAATSGIAGVHAHTSQDLELEAHLNRLNKHAVKTIQSEDGDIIDCVDINKQPAFDHPLLKNHTIQMHPTFVPKMENNNTTALPVLEQTWQKGGSCPDGTVPIRRVHKNDLLRAASLESFGTRVQTPEQDQAGVSQTRWGPYVGASADINVWAISVQPNEWSHSAIEISDRAQYFIEAGVLVNPSLFGDGQTRLYIYWTADGYRKTGCYNLLCSGFVQVSKKFALGGIVHPLSILNGQQFVTPTAVFKDVNTHNWWLKIMREPVGYWPKEIFGGKYEQAWQVKWIGSILNTWNDGHHTTTQMGSGRFPREGFGKAAFFQNVKVMDTSYQFAPPIFPSFYATNGGCYACREERNKVILFYYGGPGGADCHLRWPAAHPDSA